MSDCIFCKIIDGELPSAKVYEDEYVYAFMDIGQVTEGHVLLIPKSITKTFMKWMKKQPPIYLKLRPKLRTASKKHSIQKE